MNGSPVAVTGAGCLCGPGLDLPSCMRSLFAGSRQPLPPKRISSSHPTVFPVFEVEDDLSGVWPAERPEIFRTSKLTLAAAHEALVDAGLDRAALAPLRVGVCIGTTVGCSLNSESFYAEVRKGGLPALTPAEICLRSNPADVLADAFGARGPCQTVVNACASGSDAIGIGASWIRSGLCDVVLAGGADELSRVTYNGFISLKVTDDSPCRPFDQSRRGLNLGEGAAVLILESAERRRGRKTPRAYLRGYGAACDAYHLTAPSPEGVGLRRALREAMEQCGGEWSGVGFVNAHGTGTADNDRVEGRVLKELLPGVPFLSTKGYTGHTLGAAGAIEAAFTVACLEEGRIPASAGFSIQDPELGTSPAERVTAVKGSLGLSQSLAFGGHNAVLVFGREPE